MISVDEFSEMLRVLYSVPLREDGWGHFLDLLARNTGSKCALLLCANGRVGLSIQEQGGVPIDQAIVTAYATTYAVEDPYKKEVMRVGKVGVLDCRELLPYEEFWKTNMYLHLNQPAGVMYPGLMVLTLTAKRYEVISVWRSPEEGEIPADATRLLELLFPHVQQAMEIRYALGVLAARAKGAEAVADASRTPAFLLSADGQVIHENRAAKLLLNAGDGLAVEGGRLLPVDAAQQGALGELVRRAAVKEAGARDGVMLLERGNGRQALQLLAAPVDSARVLLLVCDPEQPVDVGDELIAETYGLTPVEIEVANGLLTGYSVEEIAALRKVQPGTVRLQLKSIFKKMGVNRQSEVVRKLMVLVG